MQNKPNFLKAKMALNLCSEKHYGKTYPFQPTAKQTQSNPISPPKSRPTRKKTAENLEYRPFTWYNPENNPYRPV